MRFRSAIVSFVSLFLLVFPNSTLFAQAHGATHEKMIGEIAQVREPYTAFASATPASDPADSVCARHGAGSAVVSPTAIYSSNGVLETTFYFDTVVDQAGLTRYCYIAKGGYEGPTLRVNPGDQLIIHFYNTVPTSNASSAMPGMVMSGDATAATTTGCSATSVSSASTNLHFHGLNVPPVCHQDEVVHTVVQPQTEFDYTVQIPADEPAGMYWYHPHPHGFSQNQVLGGATGVIIVEGIQNFNSAVKQLPERVMVLRDQALTAANQSGAGAPGNDLSINYIPVTYPTYTPAVINTPIGTKEFWRVANTAANSVLNLQIVDAGVAQTMQVVAVDGVPITDGSGNPTTHSQTSVLMPPGSRAEFIYVTPESGHTAKFSTTSWNNGPDGDADPARTLATIISSSSTSDGGLPVTSTVPISTIPNVTQSIPTQRFRALNTADATVQRTLYFSIKSDFSQFYITVNGQTPAAFSMSQNPNLVVRSGTVEQWTIQNRSLMDHAFHIHQIHFRTLAVNGTSVTDYTERDTVDVPHWSGNSSDPYPSVTLLMDFTSPEIIGTFVYHCHVLSHEDLGMMGEIQILPPLVDPTISTKASATAVAPGTSVTLTATVSGSSGTPSGTVTFLSGSTTLGTATLNSSGVATYSTTALPKGSDSITAKYAGNATYSAATSSAVTVLVTSSPYIKAISPTYGAYGAYTAISGINFGASQGSSTVAFNGSAATITSWSNTSIGADYPAKSTSGSVVVHIGGVASNSSPFTVYADPVITSISPTSGKAGTVVTISGTALMDGGGAGYVLFNGVKASITSQTSTKLQVAVPSGATTGAMHVHANGVGSNNVTFTIP